MPSDKNTFSLQNKVTLIRGGAGYFNVLLELIPKLEINYDLLTHESQQLYDEVLKLSNTES